MKFLLKSLSSFFFIVCFVFIAAAPVGAEAIGSSLTPQTAGTAYFYDVTAFGANGADENSDFYAFQNSLEMARYASDQVTVYVPAGTYYIDDNLHIYSNTYFLLDDNATLKRINSASPIVTGYHKTGSFSDYGGYSCFNNITICGGIWDGNDLDGSVASSICSFRHGENITLKNLTVKNSSAHMINISGTNNTLVDNVTFKDATVPKKNTIGTLRCKEAIHLDYINISGESSGAPLDNTYCQNITVKNCAFENVFSGIGTHHLIDKLRNKNIEVKNCKFKNVLYSCVNAYGFDGLIVKDNTCQNVNMLVHVKGSAGISVTNNTVKGAADSRRYLTNIGVLQESQTIPDIAPAIHNWDGVIKLYSRIEMSGCSDAKINSNTFVNNPYMVFNAGKSKSTSLKDNTVDTADDIILNLNGGSISVTNCSFRRGKTYGVKVYNGGSLKLSKTVVADISKSGVAVSQKGKGSISDSKIARCGEAGVYIKNEGAVLNINGGYVKNCGNNGIYILSAIGEVRNCTVAGNIKNGILAKTGSELTAVANRVKVNGGCGIAVEDNSIAAVKNNTVYSNSSNGIFFKESRGDISKNNAMTNKGYGIQLNNSADVNVVKNTSTSNSRAGLSLYYSENASVLGNKVNGNKANGINFCYAKNILLKNNAVKNNKGNDICAEIKSSIYTSANTIGKKSITGDSVFSNRTPEVTAVKSTGKGQVKIKWKKSKFVSGYQIMYSTKKDFSTYVKVNIEEPKADSHKIKELMSAKTYYVKIRTYTHDAGTGALFYSNWTTVEKIKTK